jgi:hypothetical protein
MRTGGHEVSLGLALEPSVRQSAKARTRLTLRSEAEFNAPDEN